MRKGLVEGVIGAFYSIYFNPFNSLRQHLLFPVMDGASSPSAVLNIQSPPSCRPLAPLVAPKIHSTTPSVGGDIKYDLKSGGGGASSLIEKSSKTTKTLRSNRKSLDPAGEKLCGILKIILRLLSVQLHYPKNLNGTTHFA